jgi:hypothetical protein
MAQYQWLPCSIKCKEYVRSIVKLLASVALVTSYSQFGHPESVEASEGRNDEAQEDAKIFVEGETVVSSLAGALLEFSAHIKPAGGAVILQVFHIALAIEADIHNVECDNAHD